MSDSLYKDYETLLTHFHALETSHNENLFVIDSLKAELAQLKQGEPVAWLYHDWTGEVVTRHKSDVEYFAKKSEVIPLYKGSVSVPDVAQLETIENLRNREAELLQETWLLTNEIVQLKAGLVDSSFLVDEQNRLAIEAAEKRQKEADAWDSYRDTMYQGSLNKAPQHKEG